MHISSPRYMPHVLPISVFLSLSPKWYLLMSAEQDAPCYVFFVTDKKNQRKNLSFVHRNFFSQVCQSKSEAFWNVSHHTFLWWELITYPNPHSGRPPLVGSPRLLIP
jgi:hypothetical protein